MSRYDDIFYVNETELDQLTQAYENDAGFDIRASESMTIGINSIGIVPTGVILGMPAPCYCRIVGRSSGFFKRGFIVQEGLIDSGFRGELFVAIWNFPKSTTLNNPGHLPVNRPALILNKDLHIQRGDAIAQVLFHRTLSPTLTRVANPNNLPTSHRGEAGFGSSGVDANDIDFGLDADFERDVLPEIERQCGPIPEEVKEKAKADAVVIQERMCLVCGSRPATILGPTGRHELCPVCAVLGTKTDAANIPPLEMPWSGMREDETCSVCKVRPATILSPAGKREWCAKCSLEEIR
jgi:dUTPase